MEGSIFLKGRGLQTKNEMLEHCRGMMSRALVNNSEYLPDYSPELGHIRTIHEALNYFLLRGSAYGQKGFSNEFPADGGGLEYDCFDPRAVVITRRHENEAGGYIRLIHDLPRIALPSEKYVPEITQLKERGYKPTELSRLVVDKGIFPEKGASRPLYVGAWQTARLLGYDTMVIAFQTSQREQYEKRGLIRTLFEGRYGRVPGHSTVAAWHLDEITPDFMEDIKRYGGEM